jgi:hypothetical protein
MHLCYGMHMAARTPCLGCGRVIASRERGETGPSASRFEHRCPHGRPCIGWRRESGSWERGGFEHWQACAECCEAARLADGTKPGGLDCRACGTPLPFDPSPFVPLCPPPPRGSILVSGVTCAKCGVACSYRIEGERVTRYAEKAGDAAPS